MAPRTPSAKKKPAAKPRARKKPATPKKPSWAPETRHQVVPPNAIAAERARAAANHLPSARARRR